MTLNSSADFDHWSSTYDRDVQEDGEFPFDGYDRVLDQIVTLSDVRPGLAILELGVGTGNLTQRLDALGAAVWGLDFSADMLRRAGVKVPRAQLARVDLLEPFPAAFQRRFDVAVSSYVFHEFTAEGKRALLERLFATHLAPDGRVVIGDVGFASSDALDRVRLSAGARWDDEYFWLQSEAAAIAASLGLMMRFKVVSSCGVVVTFDRA